MLPPFLIKKTMDKPTIEDERELMSINDNDATIVSIPRSKKKFKVRWIKPYTSELITKLSLRYEGMNREVSEKAKVNKNTAYSPKEVAFLSKFSAMMASLCLLNGMKIFFLHWMYWRWIYYVKGYDYEQLESIISVAKKKVPQAALLRNTVWGTQAKITNMTMTKEEVSLFQAELSRE